MIGFDQEKLLGMQMLLEGLASIGAGVSGGIWTCNYIYAVQVVRSESRSACLVISSIITIPVTFLSYLSRFLSERFGSVL